MAEKKCGKVLLVDNEANTLKVLAAILEEEGYDVLKVETLKRAIKLIEQNPPDVVVSEYKMPDKSGSELFEVLKDAAGDIPLIFLTAYGSIDSAVRCMADGAYYYYIKPPDYQDLVNTLGRAVEESRINSELEQIRNRMGGEEPLQVLGRTAVMRHILEMVDTLKNSSSNVLVVGETGTGKELIARALHFSGRRSYRPFVAVNCAAIPKDLIEAELFGHEKGAFTGASQRRVGRIESASGGTLFLDEIGELDIALQSKLLRVLQEKEFSRLGDNSPIEVDFRLIASTNRDLRHEVNQGNFREDLYYRLNVVEIEVPPLRERRGDIRLLAREFLSEFGAREGKVPRLSSEALRVLEAHHWPGNVRELRNIIERVVVLAKSRAISVGDLPGDIRGFGRGSRTEQGVPRLRDVEAQVISDALLRCDGNKAKAARLLGVSRKTLYKRLDEYQLTNTV